jgi:hypothetical protein
MHCFAVTCVLSFTPGAAPAVVVAVLPYARPTTPDAVSRCPPTPATNAEGIPAESLTLDETTTLLRGPSGSSVALTVAPRGPAQQTPRQLLLERRPLPQPAVKVRHTGRAPAAAAAAAHSSRAVSVQHCKPTAS